MSLKGECERRATGIGAKMSSKDHRGYHRRSKSASDVFLSCTKGESSCGAKNGQSTQQLVKSHEDWGCASLNKNFHQRKTGTSPKNHAALKDDVKRLQFELHQERSIHAVLHKTMGRASTAPSTGHGNFSAQIKELMVEIEMLEEEIASREQHVLSLYRSIFDQCISTAPSERGSSMASPVCSTKQQPVCSTKEKPKKQPAVISSAFCSSKKLPFQSLQIRGTAWKKKCTAKPKIRQDGSISSESDGVQLRSISSDTNKVDVLRRSNLSPTLKEDLRKCPNKISEEMVRYMATIYCLLHWTDPSEKAEKTCAPFLSRSSTIVLPRRSKGNKDHVSSKRLFEMSSIWSEKYQNSVASSAIKNYRLLLKQLERVNLGSIGENAKRAFWLNIYNSLVMHAYLAYGFPSSSLRRMLLIHKAAYNIGGHIVTASSIEHYILHCHTHHMSKWIETMFLTAKRKKNGEEHLTKSCYALSECEPLVLFALCTGSSTDPMLRVYTPKNLSDELQKARKEYFQANVVIKRTKTIFLPKVVERYAKQASLSHGDLLEVVLSSLDGKYPDFVQNCRNLTRKKASQMIEWLPHNYRFYYVFAKNLTRETRIR